VDATVGLVGLAEAEVLGPTRQKSVEPDPQLGPRRRVAPVKQSVDLLLEPLLRLLRRPGRDESLPGLPVPRRSKGIAQEVERLFPRVTEACFGRVDRQATPLVDRPRRDELLENLDERKLKAWKEERARQAVACRDGKLRLFPEMLTCPPIDPDRRPGRVHQPVLPHPEALVALEGSLSRFPGVSGGSSHLLQLPRAVEGRTFTAQLAVSSEVSPSGPSSSGQESWSAR
jgi:hypothetical protein